MQRFTRRLQHSTAALAPAAVIAAGCVGLYMAAGCATSTTSETSAAEPLVDAKAALAARVQSERARPVESSTLLPPPPGVDPNDVERLRVRPGDPATLPLEAAVAEYAASTPSTQPAAGGRDPQALRAYARGRLKLLAGEIESAMAELESATRLDPGAPQPWRELGMAQLAANRRSSATASFQKAASLGLNDPAVLWLLGRDELRLRRIDTAMGYLTRAAAAGRAMDDPALHALIHADLAAGLQALGRIEAARASLVQGLALEPETAARSRFRQEAASLLRQRGELWIQVGDMSSQLGQYESALAAYERAAEVPSIDPGQALLRQVHALLKLGRPAEAALRLVDDIRQNEGRVEDRHTPVLEFLAQRTDVGPLLSGAIAQIATDMSGELTPTIASRLARAAAAVSSPQQARAILADHLERRPFDGDTVLALLGTIPAERTAERIRTLIDLTSRTPLASGIYANVVLTMGEGIDRTMSELDKTRNPAGALLHAELLARLGKPGEALQRLRRINATDAALQTGIARASVEIALAAGDPEAAAAATALLAPSESADSPRRRAAYAESLGLLNRAAEGVAALAETINAPEPSTDALALAAQLSLDSDNPQQAAAILRRLMTVDPFDERSYEGLIDLHLPSGPLASETQLADVIRSLRQRIPSSRTLRGLNAQELLSRGILSQAEESVLSLIGSEYESPTLLRLLVAIWERQIAADSAANPPTGRGQEAEAWLRARLEKRPESATLIAALARILAARGEADAAVDLLSGRLDRWPIAELARLREDIIRVNLNDPDRADALAVARLEAGPRSAASSAELASLLVRRGDLTAAAEVVARDLGGDIRNAGEAAPVLLTEISKVTPDSIGEDPERAAAAGVLYDSVIRSISTPPRDILVARLLLAAIAKPGASDELAASSREIVRRFPDAAMSIYGGVVSALARGEDPSPALRYLGSLAMLEAAGETAILTEWIRLTAGTGDREDLDYLIDSVQSADKLAAGIRMVSADEEPLPETRALLRGEFAYSLGLFLAVSGRDELSEHAYRRALSFNPEHAWASNNLGYALADRGESMEEAQKLLELAYSKLPQNPSVIDSLAWLRYKQGWLRTAQREPNSPPVQGAFELFTRAVRTDQGSANPVILDHYGDTAWRIGDKALARVMWLNAREILDEVIPRREQWSEEPDPRLDTYRSLLDSLAAKLDAADQGRVPPIAPLAPGVADPILPPPGNAAAEPVARPGN